MRAKRQMHGSCVCKDGNAVLVTGSPGAGKSGLALRLLSRGFELVADDRVDIADGMASCPDILAGLLEVRGLGIVRLPYQTSVRLALVIELDERAERMPLPDRHPELGLPIVRVDARSAAAADIVVLALDCAVGRVTQLAGAFQA